MLKAYPYKEKSSFSDLIFSYNPVYLCPPLFIEAHAVVMLIYKAPHRGKYHLLEVISIESLNHLQLPFGILVQIHQFSQFAVKQRLLARGSASRILRCRLSLRLRNKSPHSKFLALICSHSHSLMFLIKPA